MFHVCRATYQRINHPLITAAAPCPSAACSSCTVCQGGAAEGPPAPWGRGCASPREAKQLLQDANLLGAAHGAAAGCASAGSSRAVPRAVPHPCAQGKCLVSTRAGQGQHSSSCTSTCPSLRDRAPSCSKGEGASRPGARPGRKGFLPAGSSAPHLPVPKDRSSAPAWVRQEILQGPVCPGWLMRSLRHCTQKLWEGGGTSEAVSDIKTRSPRQLTGICPNPGWAASRVWVSVPSGGPHAHPDATSPAEMGQELREGGWSSPWQCPGCRAEKPPNPHPALATAGLWVTRGSNQPHKRLLRHHSAAHSFLLRDRAGASPPHLPQLASVAGWGEDGTHPRKHNLV